MTETLMCHVPIHRQLTADTVGWPILHTFVAATDTTRFTLFNVWVLLALSRRVQDKLFEEQQQVCISACGCVA